MDFFICSSFVLLFVYAYFSRQVLHDKLRREEEERLKLEHSANSLKEELKIVYYHTSKLEEALKAEQDNHKNTNSRLTSQSQDFKINMTMLQKQYAAKLKEKNENIKTYMLENEELKEKHKLVEQHFNILADEHKKAAIKIKADYDKLKKSNEEESLRLQDKIQETYNHKVYFQKKAVLTEDDYKKTLKKLARCKSILSRRNITTQTQMQKILSNKGLRKHTTISKINDGKMLVDMKPTQVSIIEEKPLPAQTINRLPIDKVIKRDIPDNLPTEKMHSLSKTSPTMKVKPQNMLDTKEPDTLGVAAVKKISLHDNSSSTLLVTSDVVKKEQVASLVKSELPLAVTHKAPEVEKNSADKSKEHAGIGNKHTKEHEIESNVAMTKLKTKLS